MARVRQANSVGRECIHCGIDKGISGIRERWSEAAVNSHLHQQPHNGLLVCTSHHLMLVGGHWQAQCVHPDSAFTCKVMTLQSRWHQGKIDSHVYLTGKFKLLKSTSSELVILATPSGFAKQSTFSLRLQILFVILQQKKHPQNPLYTIINTTIRQKYVLSKQLLFHSLCLHTIIRNLQCTTVFSWQSAYTRYLLESFTPTFYLSITAPWLFLCASLTYTTSLLNKVGLPIFKTELNMNIKFIQSKGWVVPAFILRFDFHTWAQFPPHSPLLEV